MSARFLIGLVSIGFTLGLLPNFVAANEPLLGKTNSGVIFTSNAEAALLNAQLEQAVAAQNWRRAIQVVDKLIAYVPKRASELKSYRVQLQRLLSAGVKVPQALLTQTQQPARVQVKRRASGIAVIDVLFNGKQRFEMAVDSGASLTVITRSMATALGLTSADVIDRVVFMTAGGTTTLPIVYLDRIAVGSLETSKIPVAIAGPEMTIGLLGQDFLQNYDVSFRGNVIEFDTPKR